MERIGRFLRENRALTAAYLVFTAILLYQHSLGWNWDFLVYSMNGAYIFHGGSFMEWLRPPLVPVVLGLLQFVFPVRLAEYVFIGLSSTAFLYAVHRFIETEDLDGLVFYALLLTPGAVAFSTSAGTELLSLALVLLFFTDIDGKRAGLWLGLLVLTRYPYAFLIPALLLQVGWRRRFRSLAVAGSVTLPWAVYSHVKTGDPFTSPVSFFALHTVLREETTAASPFHFLAIVLPTALVLLALASPRVRERAREFVKSRRTAVLMAYLAAVAVLLYLGSGVKRPRFLYPLVLPTAYFAAATLETVDARRFIYSLLAFNLVLGFFAAGSIGHEPPTPYRHAAENAEGCMVESDLWVPLSYAGLPATHPVDRDTTLRRLSGGWRVVDFTGEAPSNVTEIEGVEMLRDAGSYRVYGDPGKCAGPRPVDGTRIDEFNAATGNNYTPTSFLLDLGNVLEGRR